MQKRMKILVYGAGAVGSVFGGFLSKDHEVTLLGRAKHLNAIRNKSLRITGIWGRHHFHSFYLETNQNRLRGKSFDLVFVAVKAYDTLSAAKFLKKILAPQVPVVLLQNGLGNIEIFKRFFPLSQLLAGRVIFGAEIPKPGEVKITVMANPTAIGETGPKRKTQRLRHLVQVCQRAGIPCVSTFRVESLLWAKVLYNCALNPLASLLECHYGQLMEKPITRLVMNEVLCEIYEVARKNKIILIPASPKAYMKLFYSKLVPKTYHHHPSMLQDLQKGKKTEIEVLNGAIVRLGRKAGMAAPVNAMLAKLIRKKEKERR